MSDDTGRCTGIGAMLARAGAGLAATGVDAPDAGTEDEGGPCDDDWATEGGASCRTGTFEGVRDMGVVLRGAEEVLALAGGVYE